MWREIERAEFVHSVDDGLDDDVFVLQDGSFRLTVSLPFIRDNVEFGESAKILADCALVSIELASEVTNRFDVLTVLIEVLDDGKAAVGEDVAPVLPAQDEDIRVSSGIEIGCELVLLENSLGDAIVRWAASAGIGL